MSASRKVARAKFGGVRPRQRMQKKSNNEVKESIMPKRYAPEGSLAMPRAAKNYPLVLARRIVSGTVLCCEPWAPCWNPATKIQPLFLDQPNGLQRLLCVGCAGGHAADMLALNTSSERSGSGRRQS